MSVLEAIAIIVGVVTGVSGLVLGILNHKHHRDTTRPRLIVRPRILTLVDRDTKETEKNVGVIEVCNVGHVPVIGSTVGFKAKRKGEKGYIIVAPKPINGEQWPGELKPGHVVMLRMLLDSLPNAGQLGSAFATTIVGDTFVASKRDTRIFEENLRDMKSSE